MSLNFVAVRRYVNRSLITILVLSIVGMITPASARASEAADATSRPGVASHTDLLAPGALQQAISLEARRASLQATAPTGGTTGDSRVACRTGGLLLVGAGVAFATAIVKHFQWTSSSEPTVPGSTPPSSVGVSVGIGGVLAGVGIFQMSRACRA